MSNTNYDVELSITYDPTYKHYIPTYAIAVPHQNYWTTYGASDAEYYCFISFDDGKETEIGYYWYSPSPNARPPVPFYNIQGRQWENYERYLPDMGIKSKCYFRNPVRDATSFTPQNCFCVPRYGAKAAFEVQWNSIGFAAVSNQKFRCSTIQKDTLEQYSWTGATVYYKETTDANYSTAAGIISGTWSDTTISTNIILTDGHTYDIYIEATSDDGETAQTPVAQFTTTDADAVATCISPSGAFTSGEVNFVWSHTTEYGTPQYAYDLQYSINNGSSWTTIRSHEVTPNTTDSITLTDAGVYLWRVRTYNSNDVAGEWAEATFVNNVPTIPPTNVMVTTKGRPTVTWTASSQSAYQVQFLLGDSVVYDSGAVYTSEKSHFVNQYFNDTRSYAVRVRIYNALGEISDWTETGYQQPSVTDVQFTVGGTNGATIRVIPNVEFVKYYLLRNNKLIAEITNDVYVDKYAVGQVNYSVVGVTSDEQSDIQSQGYRVVYDNATITAMSGQQFAINKRVNEAYAIQTNNEADINKANFIGDGYPTHYSNDMRLKSFSITCFDDQGFAEELLGTLVFYADNFGNGGWCMVTAYDKTDNFIKNGQGVYANEVSLTLEVTNYDDSIEYAI